MNKLTKLFGIGALVATAAAGSRLLNTESQSPQAQTYVERSSQEDLPHGSSGYGLVPQEKDGIMLKGPSGIRGDIVLLAVKSRKGDTLASLANEIYSDPCMWQNFYDGDRLGKFKLEAETPLNIGTTVSAFAAQGMANAYKTAHPERQVVMYSN